VDLTQEIVGLGDLGLAVVEIDEAIELVDEEVVELLVEAEVDVPEVGDLRIRVRSLARRYDRCCEQSRA